MALVADDLWKVLDESPTVGDVQQLHSPADRQQRQPAAFHSRDERQLAGVTLLTGSLGTGVRLARRSGPGRRRGRR